jgi:hypothetical protein
MPIMTEYQKIKELILTPSLYSKDGTTDLENRARINATKVLNGDTLEKELELLLELSGDLQEFDSQALIRLFDFIQNSKVNSTEIAESYLNYILKKSRNLNYYQKARLLTFISQTIPNNSKLSADVVNIELADLKKNDPWLFVEILSNISVERSIEFINYLKKIGKLKNAVVKNTVLKWLNKNVLEKEYASNLLEILPESTIIKKKILKKYPELGQAHIGNPNSISLVHLYGTEPFKRFKKAHKNKLEERSKLKIELETRSYELTY